MLTKYAPFEQGFVVFIGCRLLTARITSSRLRKEGVAIRLWGQKPLLSPTPVIRGILRGPLKRRNVGRESVRTSQKLAGLTVDAGGDFDSRLHRHLLSA